MPSITEIVGVMGVAALVIGGAFIFAYGAFGDLLDDDTDKGGEDVDRR